MKYRPSNKTSELKITERNKINSVTNTAVDFQLVNANELRDLTVC